MAGALTLVAAGCGTHDRSSGGSGDSASLGSLMKRPGEDVGVVAGDSDFAVGDVRFSFLVILGGDLMGASSKGFLTAEPN